MNDLHSYLLAMQSQLYIIDAYKRLQQIEQRKEEDLLRAESMGECEFICLCCDENMRTILSDGNTQSLCRFVKKRSLGDSV